MNAERNGACEFPGPSSKTFLVFTSPDNSLQLQEQVTNNNNCCFESVDSGVGVSISIGGQGEVNGTEQLSLPQEGYFSQLSESQSISEILPHPDYPEAVNNQGVKLEASQATVQDLSTTTVFQSRRRPRKTNPKTQEVPGPVYTSYTPQDIQLPPQKGAVTKTKTTNLKRIKEDLAPILVEKIETLQDLPLAVPSCIPRYFDQKRKVVTLSPNSVSVKFWRTQSQAEQDEKTPGLSQPYLVVKNLASKRESFSRILLASDIHQPHKSNDYFGLIESKTFSFDGALVTPQEPTISVGEFVLPKKTLIIRHPLLKTGDQGQTNFAFPVEKVLEDGSRNLIIKQGFVVRKAGNIEIKFNEEEDIKTYLANIQANMDQFNQINDYQLHITESNFVDESAVPCYSYDYSNGTSQMSTIQYQQQPQAQQQTLYYSPVEDCSNNQTYVPTDAFYIYTIPNPNQSIPIQDDGPVELSVVSPTHHQPQLSQQMSVIRTAPVYNSQIQNSYTIELPNDGNFLLREDGEVVNSGNIVNNVDVNASLVNTPNPKPKKVKVAKPRASPKVKKSVQNLNIPMPNDWRSPDSTSNSNTNDIPFKGFTDTEFKIMTPVKKTKKMTNHSGETKNPTSLHSNSVISTIAAATNKNIVPIANSGVNQTSSVVSSSANCRSNNRIYGLPKQSGVVCASTPGTLLSSSEVKVQLPVVVEKPEEKEEIRTDLRYKDGYLAMCQHCGIGSEDLHKCVRCKHRLPPNLHIVADNWKIKTIPKTDITAPSVTASITTDVKIEMSKPAEQIIVSKKRSLTKKIKSETPTPAKKVKGGGRRGKQEECIVLSSDDEGPEEPKAKIPKEEETESVMSENSPTKSESVITKTLKVNLTQLKLPLNTDVASTTPMSSGPKIVLSRQQMEGGGSSNLDTTMDITPEEVIEAIESMTTSSASKGSFVTIECRSIRVGDYKSVTPSSVRKMFKVVFSQRGILFSIPHAEQKSKVMTCAVPAEKILNIAVHFRQRLPVVFVTTGPKYATWIRKRLGLKDTPSDANYFCSLNGGRCQKYITFLASSFSDMDINAIKQIYGLNLHEMDYVRANELLMQITPEVSDNPKRSINLFSDESPSTSGNFGNSGLTHSLRSTTGNNIVVSTAVKKGQPEMPQVDCSGNRTIMMYKGMPVLQQDILCLADEQFLNDSIIDFWMRYTQNELLTPGERDRTYMFSTFFYKRLTTKNKKRAGVSEEDSKLTNAEKRHARVKRWTKDVDIFEKDFIIIPINENCHWFLAVICYPGLKGVHNLITGDPIPDYKKRKGKGKGKTQVPQPSLCNGDAKSDVPSGTDDHVPNLDLNEKPIPAREDKVSEDSDELKIKQPCILIFDSLAGEPRNRVYSTLREYLKIEHKTRKGEDRDYNKASMPGGMPHVPQQPNHCDCGIFTLFYVHCFFRKPITSFEIPVESTGSWLLSDFDGKREEIYKSVKELVARICPDTLGLIPHLTFPPPLPTLLDKKKQKEQIRCAPVEKVEKVPSQEEPMDVDVCASSLDQGNQIHASGNDDPEEKGSVQSREVTPLRQTVPEMVRASPTDNDHDHDYAPKR